MGGEQACLVGGRLYTHGVAGDRVSGEGAGVSELLSPANTALQAAEASREGNWPAAVSGLQSALAAVPGDAIIEPGGVVDGNCDCTIGDERRRPIACESPVDPLGADPNSGIVPRSIVESRRCLPVARHASAAQPWHTAFWS